MKDKVISIFVFLFVLYFFYASISFVKISAATYDETVHISSGYSYLVTGRYLMNIFDHPPLAEMIAALPLKFINLNSFITHKFYLSLMPYHYGDLFLYHNIQDAEKILNISRYFLLFLWGGLFIASFYLWGKVLGKYIYFISVILFSINPVFISNIPLATTDIAPSFFYFITFLFGYLLFNSNLRYYLLKNEYYLIVFAGIASGLAMTSKYSMFILPPFFVILLMFNNFLTNKFNFSQLLKLILIYMVISVIVLLFVFKGNLTLYSDALIETFKRLDKGRSSFIMGKYSIEGVWYYFPVAFLIKNPIFFIISWLAGFIIVLKEWRKFIWILLPFLIYFLASINSKVQIGVRHLIPIIPFAILMASIGIKKILEKYSFKLFYLIMIIFVFSLFSVIKTHPFYLSYFSEIIGGAKNGYKYLTDSNIDWGQDIKSLAKYLKGNGNPPIILSYFGVANPYYYGIRFIPLWFITNVNFDYKEENLCSSNKLFLAVSVTNLMSTYYRDKESFKWLEDLKPVYKAGYSIFLYDLTNDYKIIDKLYYIFNDIGLKNTSECLKKFKLNNK